MLSLDRLCPQAIMIVDLQGAIGNAIRPLETSRLLARLREDESARAVILNIDSPGGSAVGSDLITRAVARLAAEKPVVAYVSGLGASGGYMVASAANGILALPSALIGAIGVIAYRPLVQDALERVGVQMRVAKSGRLKDMLSPFRESTEEERAKEQHIIDAMHDLFVQSVARGRAIPEARVRELATGEVYPAADAVTAGLVDRLGDIEDAIDWAVELSGAPRRVRVLHPRRSLRDLVMGRAAVSLAEAVGLDLTTGVSGGFSALYRGPRP